jgi:hypothetical protein
MELYASGFNAWGQLRFQASETNDDPDDLHEFTCVLTGEAIDQPRLSLSYSLGRLVVLYSVSQMTLLEALPGHVELLGHEIGLH